MSKSPIQEEHVRAGLSSEGSDTTYEVTEREEWGILQELQSEFESRLPEFLSVAYEELAPFSVEKETERLVVFQVPDSFWDELSDEIGVHEQNLTVVQQAHQAFVKDTFGESYYPGDVVGVSKPDSFRRGSEAVSVELRKLIGEGVAPRNAIDFVTVRRGAIDIAEVVHKRNISFGELATIFNRCQSILHNEDN